MVAVVDKPKKKKPEKKSFNQDKPRGNLRDLADMYDDVQRVRVAAGNRIKALERGADDSGESVVANPAILKALEDAEEAVRVEMAIELAKHSIYEWLMGLPGINRTLGCRILGLIPMYSEEDFPNFSKMRVFAGLCPGRNRRVKGEKSPFSGRLRVALACAAEQFLKTTPRVRGGKNAPPKLYEDIYRKWRATYLERHGEKGCKNAEWPDLRQHYAARNKMLDVLLCHIWRKWRESKGWDVRSLYVHEKLGHQMDYEADDFSSPLMAKRKMKAKR